MNKKHVWMLAAAGLVAAGVAAMGLGRQGTSGDAAMAADSVLVTVQRGEVIRSVSSTGRVVSNLDVDIKCRASGEVIKLPFDVSERVTKGSLLLELDPMDSQRNVKKCQAAVSQSQARLEQARASLKSAEADVVVAVKKAEASVLSAQVKATTADAKAKRRRQLAEERLGSVEDLEAMEMDAATSQAELKAAQAQAEEAKFKQLTVEVRRHEVELASAQLDADQISLDDAKQQLAYTRVEAPMDGVVASRNVQTGAIISSGITNIGGGTTVLTLSDLSRVFVLVSVDEADIGQVKLGQEAEITVDAFGGEPFAGRVTRIAAKGVNTSNVVTFEVKVEVTSENRGLLKPEMTANVRIICDRRKDVLRLPAQAVTDEAGRLVVMVKAGSGTAASARQVQAGLSDGENTEITQGLQVGEQVVVPKAPASRWSASQVKSSSPPPPM